MVDESAGDRWRPAGCIHQFPNTGRIRPIPADDTNELFYVVPLDGEDRKAGHLVKLGRAECIALLGSMIQLVFQERQELSVTAVSAVLRIECDDEIRNCPKPFDHLKLRASTGPFAHGALRLSDLTLTYDTLAFAAVLNGCPEIPNLRVGQMFVVWVEHRRRFIEEGCLYPFCQIGRRNERAQPFNVEQV
ncbi:hypothetical protein FHX10_004546 [Rhizobium sp. BK591]|nr:hypothetical protein [Rhizobium sp. BK591]